MVEPGKGALNGPTAGQKGKALPPFRTQCGPQAEPKALRNPREQLAAVATIHLSLGALAVQAPPVGCSCRPARRHTLALNVSRIHMPLRLLSRK